MASNSPTQRSLKLLRARGYVAEVTEKWNPYAGIRQDLWGFVDILAIREGEILGVQTTSGSHVAERINKIAASPLIATVLSAGVKVVVHGWDKKGARGKVKRWECREELLNAESFK